MTTVTAFADLLRDFGVDVTDQVRRAQKGRQLLESGVSLDDARAVFAHIEATSKPSARPGVIAGLVLDRERFVGAVADARAFAAAAAQREQARESGDVRPIERPYVAAPDATDDEAKWAWNRRASIAWGRVRGDRAPREAVARELGVSLEVLDQLLAHAAAARPAPPRYEPRHDANEDERRKRFREEMQAARRNL